MRIKQFVLIITMLILIILLSLSKTQNYMFLLPYYQQKIIKKLSKLPSKRFQESVFQCEYNTKSENENT